MSEAVEILAPTNPDKLKRVIGAGGKASFVTKPSRTKRERIVVGWLSDLDSAKHRKELVDIVDLVVGGSDGVPQNRAHRVNTPFVQCESARLVRGERSERISGGRSSYESAVCVLDRECQGFGVRGGGSLRKGEPNGKARRERKRITDDS